MEGKRRGRHRGTPREPSGGRDAESDALLPTSGEVGHRKAPRLSAVAAAVRLLSYSARTEQELHAALLRRGYSEGEVADTMSRMKDLGYVDDPATARRWAESAAGDRRWGVAGIARRLAQRGIDPDLAAESARQAYEETGGEEYEVALELAKSRIDGDTPEDHEERERQMRRLAGFLQRRGFGAETVARVLRQLF